MNRDKSIDKAIKFRTGNRRRRRRNNDGGDMIRSHYSQVIVDDESRDMVFIYVDMHYSAKAGPVNDVKDKEHLGFSGAATV
ncbi:unnamed protein product [Sphenostylis stenocarpa]|uniref:Uncharacterized protein n=1 Tax=Sphenostylis stenocarpa TaxID=92480 RepID=A0AA86SZG9_9FABA|nr:unnamed protein product [Sphenostylis stenocarpa]